MRTITILDADGSGSGEMKVAPAITPVMTPAGGRGRKSEKKIGISPPASVSVMCRERRATIASPLKRTDLPSSISE
jgi:hypothetical protein